MVGSQRDCPATIIRSIDPRYLADLAACTNATLGWLMTEKGDPGRKARDPMSSKEEKLLQDFRRLTPKVRAEVGRLVSAIAEVQAGNCRGDAIRPKCKA